MAKQLPPDPESMNNDRAEWAEKAIDKFIDVTRTDTEDALSDLLCNLRHWADRNGQDWTQALDRAMRNYAEETME
jgi:hypothetical protein